MGPDTESVYRVPVGRIIDISIFGEVDIALNQSAIWKPKSLDQLGDLSQLSKDTLTMYIEPSEDWHLHSPWKPEAVNFTWEIREIAYNKIRIKLNFSDPLSVSPYLRYDKLHIYMGDAMKLFDRYSFSDRRELTHQRFDVLMTKPIQKQMIDNHRGRQMIEYLYEFRFIVSDIFLACFFIGIFFRSPFDRLLKMMLEL